MGGGFDQNISLLYTPSLFSCFYPTLYSPFLSFLLPLNNFNKKNKRKKDQKCTTADSKSNQHKTTHPLHPSCCWGRGHKNGGPGGGAAVASHPQNKRDIKTARRGGGPVGRWAGVRTKTFLSYISFRRPTDERRDVRRRPTDERRDVRSAGMADWITARGGNTERTLTAAAGPSPCDPYRQAPTMRPSLKARPLVS